MASQYETLSQPFSHKVHVSSCSWLDSMKNSQNLFVIFTLNKTYSHGSRFSQQVVWRREKDLHPLTIGMFTFVPDERISVDYNQRTNEWSLIIHNVNPADEATYNCQISTKDSNTRSYKIKLNVKSKVLSITREILFLVMNYHC